MRPGLRCPTQSIDPGPFHRVGEIAPHGPGRRTVMDRAVAASGPPESDIGRGDVEPLPVPLPVHRVPLAVHFGELPHGAADLGGGLQLRPEESCVVITIFLFLMISSPFIPCGICNKSTISIFVRFPQLPRIQGFFARREMSKLRSFSPYEKFHPVLFREKQHRSILSRPVAREAKVSEITPIPSVYRGN